METRAIIFVAFLVAVPSTFVLLLLLLTRASRKIVIAGTVATIVLLLTVHCLTLDGLDGFVFKSLTPDDTQFASNYSALGFWRVRNGMTPQQVKSLAGPPLQAYPVAGGYGWSWSRSPHDSNYRLRVVIFVAGRVFEKFNEYYVD